MAVNQPTPIPLSREVLHAIAARLDVPHVVCNPVPLAGSGNAMYALGDQYILRVPHHHPTHTPIVHGEVAAVTAARNAGVHTPSVVLCDDSCSLLPVPYTIYERIHGIPLSSLAPHTAAPDSTWFAVGQDLARLHTGVTADTEAGRLAPRVDNPDPRPWLDQLMHAHRLAEPDAVWLDQWLTSLWPFVQVHGTPAFCHGDVNASNIMVAHTTFAYHALIDWGGIMWHDPAWDFVPLTLAAVPAMLEGYRSMAVLPNDAQAEARILAYHVQFAIWGIHFRPKPEPGWASARIARLRASVAKFLEHPRAQGIAHL